MKAINLNIYGIKCDNPNCDYRDMTVQPDHYKEYLNKPCPKCGTNLLTDADYKTMKRIIRLAKIFNFIFCRKDYDESQMIKGHIDMDGTGKADIRF